MQHPHTPFLLIILDGWGYREEREHNAIAQANTPVWRELWQTYPHILLSGSGKDVGLPEGQMGNSEVGHLTMGAGRLIRQDLARIDHAIADQTFFHNQVLLQAFQQSQQNHSNVHILGLLSPGGVHSHERQILALCEMAKKNNIKNLYLHAFLDGRDTSPKSAITSVEAVLAKFKEMGCGHIASLCGRYYAMDRDKRYDRTQQAYELLTAAKADFTETDPITAIKHAYERGETDEFIKPTLIVPPNTQPIKIQDNDVVIFMNFRADRARQLSRALIQDDFQDFKIGVRPKLASFVTLTQYAKDIPSHIAFPPQYPENNLGAVLAAHHYKQLRIAETEKYAHVTFFFNGGIEVPYPLEDRVLIPSPKIATYDLQPEMSAYEVTAALIERLSQYDFILCNFANPDMVGHTGNFPATIKAIETIDHCLGKIYQALKKLNGEMMITSDHGNAEKMYDPTKQQPHTAHTNYLVPLIYVGRQAKVSKKIGVLRDIAPSILHLLDLPKPNEMSGEQLFYVS